MDKIFHVENSAYESARILNVSNGVVIVKEQRQSTLQLLLAKSSFPNNLTPFDTFQAICQENIAKF